MVTVQAADAAPSSSVQEAAPKSSVRGPPGRRAPLDKAIAHYHSRIPPSTLRRWHENIREFCMQASVSGVIKTGSGCTGCDIFSHVVTHVTEYWRSNFALPQLGEVQNVLCSEIHEEKNNSSMQSSTSLCWCRTSANSTMRRCRTWHLMAMVWSSCPTLACMGQASVVQTCPR